MFDPITSRFNEKNNSDKIALNLFQEDIKDYNENDEYEDILTKRGKNKNKSKIEYFKNYIKNFKEIKFKTARPIEIFRKKEEKKQKELKKDINKIKENIIDNNKFKLIKENFQEEKKEQKDKINNNNIINRRNKINNKDLNKAKKTNQEISNKIIKNNEDILNKLKRNKKITKIIEKEKEKMQNKIKKIKQNEKSKKNAINDQK